MFTRDFWIVSLLFLETASQFEDLPTQSDVDDIQQYDPRSAYKPHSVHALCAGGHLSMQPTRDSNGTSSSLSLLGLAPDEGCLAAYVAIRAGRLLPCLFTLAGVQTRGFERLGGLFLWPDP